MRKVITFLTGIVIVAGCAPDRISSPPISNDVWYDPPFRKEIDVAYEAYELEIERAMPILTDRACSKMGETVSAEVPLCRGDEACVEEVAARVARSRFPGESYAKVEEVGELVRLKAASTRHVESLIVPGLESHEWSTILAAECESSPFVDGYTESESVRAAFRQINGRQNSLCETDYLLFVELSKNVWRALAELQTVNESACTR